MPGGDLDAGVAAQQRLDERPRRRPVVDVEGAAAAPCGGPGRRRRRRTPRWSTVVASATVTAPGRPSAARLASATATRTGSRSTPGRGDAGLGRGQQVAADAAAEVDQGAGAEGLPAGRRGAGRPRSRVACSSPSGVKYIRAARSPNLATARRRSAAWVRAAATCAGSAPRRTRRVAAQRGVGRAAGRRRPARRVDGRARAAPGRRRSSSQRKASRSTRAILSDRGRREADPCWHSVGREC